jgi:hypothetical protein
VQSDWTGDPQHIYRQNTTTEIYPAHMIVLLAYWTSRFTPRLGATDGNKIQSQSTTLIVYNYQLSEDLVNSVQSTLNSLRQVNDDTVDEA